MSNNIFNEYRMDEFVDFVPPMNKRDFENLKRSLKENGYAGPPILYRMKDGGKQIVDGRNRFMACKELNIIPVFEQVNWDDAETKEKAFVYNVTRRQLSPTDIAAAMIAHGQSNISTLVKHSGLSESHVKGIATKIERGGDAVKEAVLNKVQKGEPTIPAFQPGITREVKIRKSIEEGKRDWFEKLPSNRYPGFALFVLQMDYTSIPKALSAVITQVANAAEKAEKQGRHVVGIEIATSNNAEVTKAA